MEKIIDLDEIDGVFYFDDNGKVRLEACDLVLDEDAQPMRDAEGCLIFDPRQKFDDAGNLVSP